MMFILADDGGSMLLRNAGMSVRVYAKTHNSNIIILYDSVCTANG